jgi:hypothetical protein
MTNEDKVIVDLKEIEIVLKPKLNKEDWLMLYKYLSDCEELELYKWRDEQNKQYERRSLNNTKKVKLNLVGLDGNAFCLMGAFQRQARKEGWTEAEIKAVLEECKKSDYNHLLNTLSDHCEDTEED